jgi:hypothetical protein
MRLPPGYQSCLGGVVERFFPVAVMTAMVLVLALVVVGFLGSVWHVGPMAELFKVHYGGGYGPEGFPL